MSSLWSSSSSAVVVVASPGSSGCSCGGPHGRERRRCLTKVRHSYNSWTDTRPLTLACMATVLHRLRNFLYRPLSYFVYPFWSMVVVGLWWFGSWFLGAAAASIPPARRLCVYVFVCMYEGCCGCGTQRSRRTFQSMWWAMQHVSLVVLSVVLFLFNLFVDRFSCLISFATQNPGAT